MANRIYPNAWQQRKAERKRQNEYKKQSYTAFTIRFHNVMEKDVIDRLQEVDNRKKYIIDLVRKDIEANK